LVNARVLLRMVCDNELQPKEEPHAFTDAFYRFVF
jgi:hypothetical protein